METTQTITVTTEVKASLSQVWRSWTQPQHITQWNNASDDWHTPAAENDLKKDGKFKYTMAAKDGSVAFDFEGKYAQIIENKLIEYTIADGRKVKITFEAREDAIKVTEAFEPESENSIELQKGGWQAILDNFKYYTESLNNFDKLHHEIYIDASPEKVYTTMLEEKPYREWTSVFNPGSHFKGSWEKDAKIIFIGTDEEGNEGGMISRIKENIPNQFISIEHLGMVGNGEEITSGPEVEPWAGALENYTFESKNGGTLLKIDVDTNKEYQSYFDETWPKALKILKTICEK